jgi:hypothetical protein
MNLLRRICLFLRIVWRRGDNILPWWRCKIGIRTAWDVAGIMWGPKEK